MWNKKVFTFIAIALSLTTIFACCPNTAFIKNKKPRPQGAIWHPTDYVQCDLGLTQSSMPFNLAFTLYRSDLPFGRYDALSSTRAYILYKNGTALDVGSRFVDPGKEKQTAVNPASWSPDGSKLLISKLWHNPVVGMQEEAAGALYLDEEGYLGTGYVFNLQDQSSRDLLTDGALSFFQALDEYLPGGRITFSAIINGESRMYEMNEDGSNKRPISNTGGFMYGMHQSPDGTKYSYHSNYQIYIGDVATKAEVKVNNPCPFNFNPQWSPDSQKVIFQCGQTGQIPDLYIANRDGSGARFLISRNGFNNDVPFTDGPDFHGGGSDNVAYSADSKLVYISVKIGDQIELVSVDLDTSHVQQLTFSNTGEMNNYPYMSHDGLWLSYTKLHQGKRDIFIMNTQTNVSTQVTNMLKGCGIKYPKWSPQ